MEIEPLRMLLIQLRALSSHERRQPQTGPEAFFVDLIGQDLHALREFLRIRLQPVAHRGFPAVVDLEEITGL